MKLLNPTVADLIACLGRYADPEAAIGCHTMGNGIDVRIMNDGPAGRVELVGFNSVRPTDFSHQTNGAA